jgi:hypothetical protein
LVEGTGARSGRSPPRYLPKLQHFDEQGFIGAPEYGQARVIPTPDRPGKTAGSINHPERETD